jgi:hypothetical protein
LAVHAHQKAHFLDLCCRLRLTDTRSGEETENKGEGGDRSTSDLHLSTQIEQVSISADISRIASPFVVIFRIHQGGARRNSIAAARSQRRSS